MAAPYTNQTAGEADIDTKVTNETAPGGITRGEVGGIMKGLLATAQGPWITINASAVPVPGHVVCDLTAGRNFLVNGQGQTLSLDASGLDSCDGARITIVATNFSSGILGPRFAPLQAVDGTAEIQAAPAAGVLGSTVMQGIVSAGRVLILSKSNSLESSRRSYLFDGTNDYGTVGHHASMNFGTGPFTILMMIKPTALTSRRILSKRAAGSAAWWEILINSVDHIELITSGSMNVGGATPLVVNTEYLIVFSRDGSGNLKVWWNGNIATQSGVSAAVDNSDTLQLARHYTNVQFFSGNLYALQIAASHIDVTNASLMTQIQTAKRLPDGAAVKLWYDAHERSGTTLEDRSTPYGGGSNLNNCTLVNTTPATFFASA